MLTYNPAAISVLCRGLLNRWVLRFLVYYRTHGLAIRKNPPYAGAFENTTGCPETGKTWHTQLGVKKASRPSKNKAVCAHLLSKHGKAHLSLWTGLQVLFKTFPGLAQSCSVRNEPLPSALQLSPSLITWGLLSCPLPNSYRFSPPLLLWWFMGEKNNSKMNNWYSLKAISFTLLVLLIYLVYTNWWQKPIVLLKH